MTRSTPNFRAATPVLPDSHTLSMFSTRPLPAPKKNPEQNTLGVLQVVASACRLL